MKNVLLVAIFFAISQLANAQYQKGENAKGKYFINPIFRGDYPDPSILVDGDDYYMVHSSFHYYEGLTIWHSKDLINWNIVTNALTKNVGNVWAPDLAKYDGKYYIYFPVEKTNYVIVSDDIRGPWSEPIDLNIGHIDPGHVTDEEGNRYLYFSNGDYIELTKDGTATVGGFMHSYDGWEIPRDWTIECFCMEGPKLFKRGDYYYMTVAQGGTAGPATGHMVIAARSKSPLGPWENSPHNPIIRAKSTDDKWWSVGHATVFESSSNEWWMVLHSYEKEFYNMGRQTMLAPIEWTEDGWYKLPDDFDLEKPVKKPKTKELTKSTFTLNDEFNADELNPQWHFFKDDNENRYQMTGKGIKIKAKGGGIANCSPLLVVPSDHSYTASVELEIKGNATGGLVLFYNESASSGILADSKNILANLRGWQFATEKNVINRKVHLKMKNINNVVDMYYSVDGKDWIKIENSFDSAAYHHNVLSGFLSLRIGLVSIGEGEVIFKNFQYNSL